MNDCVFCGIIAGTVPSSAVYDDDLVCAFMDIQPVNAGHVLVVPRRHVVDLAGLTDDEAARIMTVGRHVAGALRSSAAAPPESAAAQRASAAPPASAAAPTESAAAICCQGVNLWLADGVEAGQEVFHVHLHVFPRFKDDGFGLTHSKGYFDLPSRQELDTIAASLRAALEHNVNE